MTDNKAPSQSHPATPPIGSTKSSASPNETRPGLESLSLRQPSSYGTFGSPSGSSAHTEDMGSPLASSRKAERIFPISSTLIQGSPEGNESLNTGSPAGRFSAATPTPFTERSNPSDRDKIYHHFNEELERQRAGRELQSSQCAAAAADSSVAAGAGLLKHPMTMRFQHKETSDGHCVVTVSFFRHNI